MSALTPEQRDFYEQNGYILLSGLMPEEVAERAERTLWELLEADPNDPATWETIKSHHQTFDSPELVACYTPEFLDAARILGGGDEEYPAPKRGYVINTFPSEGEWKWPGPHIDHAIKDHGHKVFPRAFRVATMTFLNDVPPHGGGTIVWPGGHRTLRKAAEDNPKKYEMMWELNRDLGQFDLGEPVELTPKRGDVLFYHYLCPHSGSKNVSDRPRLAMNAKW